MDASPTSPCATWVARTQSSLRPRARRRAASCNRSFLLPPYRAHPTALSLTPTNSTLGYETESQCVLSSRLYENVRPSCGVSAGRLAAHSKILLCRTLSVERSYVNRIAIGLSYRILRHRRTTIHLAHSCLGKTCSGDLSHLPTIGNQVIS